MDEAEFMKAQKLAIRLEKLMRGKKTLFLANVLGLLLAKFASDYPKPPRVIADVAGRANSFLISGSRQPTEH